MELVFKRSIICRTPKQSFHGIGRHVIMVNLRPYTLRYGQWLSQKLGKIYLETFENLICRENLGQVMGKTWIKEEKFAKSRKLGRH